MRNYSYALVARWPMLATRGLEAGVATRGVAGIRGFAEAKPALRSGGYALACATRGEQRVAPSSALQRLRHRPERSYAGL